ncbi:hypothetical protein EDD90_3011 [Streptomyces sp. Ag109_O5-1]|uniref:hypothetical protein n=1 Tax=Streptomyces sp. Ag109_O5-1 TaxID=1938851 RepID=UPI000F4DAB5B|nr:hypothetical protein [Streptomyces sp. Ag109_O5-1]RPE39983.1 hypothetical protein EDD90_3011 [Streptomyces sp. Ag109_O5-1]
MTDSTGADITKDSHLVYRTFVSNRLLVRYGIKDGNNGTSLASLSSAAGSSTGTDTQYATGWDTTTYTLITGTPDVNGDKIPDIWARKADGSVVFFPCTKTGVGTPVTVISSGWEAKKHSADNRRLNRKHGQAESPVRDSAWSCEPSGFGDGRRSLRWNPSTPATGLDRGDGNGIRELITLRLAAPHDKPSERASTERPCGRLHPTPRETTTAPPSHAPSRNTWSESIRQPTTHFTSCTSENRSSTTGHT